MQRAVAEIAPHGPLIGRDLLLRDDRGFAPGDARRGRQRDASRRLGIDGSECAAGKIDEQITRAHAPQAQRRLAQMALDLRPHDRLVVRQKPVAELAAGLPGNGGGARAAARIP